jgi:uncharacterized membrane protein (DUF2068 family)
VFEILTIIIFSLSLLFLFLSNICPNIYIDIYKLDRHIYKECKIFLMINLVVVVYNLPK